MTILVGQPPGGGTDAVARVVAKWLSEKWGQPVLVQNLPGAGSMIAANRVARAAPDGYTLLMGTTDLTIPTENKTNFDANKELSAITNLVAQPQILCVLPSLGVKTLNDFVALLKSQPGKLNFGDGGVNTVNYVEMQGFMKATGTDMLAVHFAGTGANVTAFLGGEVQTGFGTGATYVGLVKSGKLVPLAVSSGSRYAVVPDVPTIAETLYIPDFDITTWAGLMGPALLPDDLIQKIAADGAAAIRSPEVMKLLESQGFQIIGDKPGEFRAKVRADTDKFADWVSRH